MSGHVTSSEHDEVVLPGRAEPECRDAYVERESWYPVFGPAMILGALGAVGVVLSLFTAWHDAGVHPDRLPVAFLWHTATQSTDPSLLILLLPISVMVAVGAFVPMGTGLRLLGGLAMLVVAGAFAYQLDRAVPGGAGALGTGWYLGAIGGFLAFISGFLPESWAARRDVERSTRVIDDRDLKDDRLVR